MNLEISRDQIEFLVDFLEDENRWVTSKELSLLTDMSEKELFYTAFLSEGRVIYNGFEYKAEKCATSDDVEALNWTLIKR